MIIKADTGTFFVFDLDDTLYNEIDFLISAYKAIAIGIEPVNHVQLYSEMFQTYKSGGNAFSYIIEKYPEQSLTIGKLLDSYRNHFPEISPRKGVLEMFSAIKSKNSKIGIITDGRSITQRNKIKALGIEHFIDETIISEEFDREKPHESLYKYLIDKNPWGKFYYFGDNIEKDFITPKKLAWFCIGLIDKNNIRSFNHSKFPDDYLPHCFISKFTEIVII